MRSPNLPEKHQKTSTTLGHRHLGLHVLGTFNLKPHSPNRVSLRASRALGFEDEGVGDCMFGSWIAQRSSSMPSSHSCESKRSIHSKGRSSELIHLAAVLHELEKLAAVVVEVVLPGLALDGLPRQKFLKLSSRTCYPMPCLHLSIPESIYRLCLVCDHVVFRIVKG